MNERMSDELARVLLKRVKSAIERARYQPAETRNADAVAFEVIKPYVSVGFAARTDQRVHAEEVTDREMKRSRWLRWSLRLRGF